MKQFLFISLFLLIICVGQAETVNTAPVSEGGYSGVDYLKGVDVGNINLVGGQGSFKDRFNELWAKCGDGCIPVEPWVKGDKRHCKLKEGSCHNSRQAIDIHTIKCGRTTYKGSTTEGKDKFTQIVKCMDGEGAVTLWQTQGHDHHFHVNFPGCYKKVGCRNRSVACND